MKKLFSVLIISVFLLSSFQKKNGLVRFWEDKSAGIAEKKERIVYLFFKVDKDNSGNEKIILQDHKISEGRLKLEPSFDRNEAQKGDFIITLTEAGGKDVAKQLVKDPLNPDMEVYEKEGISRHKASLQSTEFSARFSYADNIRLVKVEKVTDSGLQLLFTQKL